MAVLLQEERVLADLPISIPLAEDGAVRLGRAASCEICLNKPAISREHARLSNNGCVWTIEDLRSRGDFWVNDRQVVYGSPWRLRDGDRIRICDVRLVFRIRNSGDPIAVDPVWIQWNFGMVRRLAEDILDNERPCSLQDLADVLEKAGCTDSTILGHCRQRAQHSHDCWVVHALLEADTA